MRAVSLAAAIGLVFFGGGPGQIVRRGLIVIAMLGVMPVRIQRGWPRGDAGRWAVLSLGRGGPRAPEALAPPALSPPTSTDSAYRSEPGPPSARILDSRFRENDGG